MYLANAAAIRPGALLSRGLLVEYHLHGVLDKLACGDG
jgi:hypothetical protein